MLDQFCIPLLAIVVALVSGKTSWDLGSICQRGTKKRRKGGREGGRKAKEERVRTRSGRRPRRTAAVARMQPRRRDLEIRSGGWGF